MNWNLYPSRIDSIVWVILLDLLDGWKLRLELLWDLEEQKNSLSLISKVLDTLLVVENMNKLVVTDPGNEEARLLDSICFGSSFSEVGNSVWVFDLNDELVVVILRIIHVILDPVGAQSLPLSNWNRECKHKIRVESNGYSLTIWTDQSGLVLSVEQVANNRFISKDVFIPSLQAGLLIALSFWFGHFDVWLLLILIEILRHEI
jgi:hypothetical protein